MNRRVIWIEAALAQLARVYVPLWGTPEGRAITEAMARVDRLLESGTHEAGESRNGFDRLVIEDPLWIDFEVHDEHALVIVTKVRYRPPAGS